MSSPDTDAIERVVSEGGATLAALVRDALACPWSRARELVSSGRVFVDGARSTDPAARLALGARVRIEPSGRRLRAGVLAETDVIHLDAELVVVRKPAGMLTLPYESGDEGTLADLTHAFLKRRDKRRGARDPMVGVVQRLDKDTTGLLVFARTMRAKRALEEQLRAHTVHRRYVAIAHGEVRDARFETWLVQDRGDGLRGSFGVFRRALGEPPRDAKRSVTHVRAREALAGATLVECRLETGRQHQIRIHLAEAGHPLVGESVYVRDYAGARIEAPRPMLHAVELGFVHPATREDVRFRDPPPADFVALRDALASDRRSHR